MLAELKRRAALFQDRTFLYFTLSGLLATLGNGLNYIALSWLAYTQSGSVSGIAVMMCFMWMPGIVFAPLFGALADKYSRKALMVLSNLVRGLAMAAWVICAWALHIELPLVILYAVLGIFFSFYMPAAIPFIQSLMPKEKLVDANATVDMIYELGTIIGMGISGFILLIAGIKGTLFLGGVLFILAGLLNWLMRSPQQSRAGENESAGLWADYVDSLRYFRRHANLFTPYAIQMLVMVLLMTVPLLLVPYTQEVLKAGSGVFAACEILYSVGAIAGGIISPMLCRALKLKNALALLLGLLALCLAALAGNSAVAPVFALYFFIGFGLASWALAVSLSQMSCAAEYQGRMQASFNGLSGAFILLIYLTMAAEGSGVSAQSVYLLLAALAAGAALLALFGKAGNMREYTE